MQDIHKLYVYTKFREYFPFSGIKAEIDLILFGKC
jgi:hypothetical protein